MPNSQPPTRWHEAILKYKYGDPSKLKTSLDSMYGQGRYRVRIQANRYYLQLPEPIPEARILEIEKAIGFHYRV